MNFGPHPLIVLTPEEWKLHWMKSCKTNTKPKSIVKPSPPLDIDNHVHNYSQYL